MPRTRIPRHPVASRHGVHRAALACALLGFLSEPCASTAMATLAPSSTAREPARAASAEQVELARYRAEGEGKPPVRGSSAEVYGGSSADRYGGSSADRGGVGGKRDERITPKPDKKKLEEEKLEARERRRAQEKEQKDAEAGGGGGNGGGAGVSLGKGLEGAAGPATKQKR